MFGVSHVFLLVVAMATSQASRPVLIHRRPTQSNLVTLVCRETNGVPIPLEDTPRYFYRPPADNRRTEFPFEDLDEAGSLVLELAPGNEGVYSCGVGEEESEGLELIAFPEALSSIAATTNYTVARGEVVELECDFPLGVLSQNYQYAWWNGLTRISNARDLIVNPDNRYSLSQDFSLLISNTQLSDGSHGNDRYRCEVTVRNPINNSPFSAIGREIQLEVYVPVSILEPLVNLVVEEDSLLELECEAEGIPIPSIQWTFNGNEISSLDASGRFDIQTEEEDGSVMTSKLTLSQAQPLDSGTFTCTAFNKPALLTNSGGGGGGGGGGGFNTSTVANITVLTNNIDELLLTTSMRPEEVFMDFTLPTDLPMPIAIMARYISDDSSAELQDEVFERKEFNNSRDIHFRIPSTQLPAFTSFSVRIAMTAEGRTSRFTGASNTITYVPRVPPIIPDAPFGLLTESKFKATIISCSLVVVAIVVAMVTGLTICFRVYHSSRRRGIKKSPFDDPDGPQLPWQAYVNLPSPSPSNTPFLFHSPNAEDEKTFEMPKEMV